MNDVPSYRDRKPGVALPPGAPPVAKIEIWLGADGNISCKAAVPNRMIFLALMETAKMDMERTLFAQEQQRKVQLPPVGLDMNLRNGS